MHILAQCETSEAYQWHRSGDIASHVARAADGACRNVSSRAVGLRQQLFELVLAVHWVCVPEDGEEPHHLHVHCPEGDESQRVICGDVAALGLAVGRIQGGVNNHEEVKEQLLHHVDEGCVLEAASTVHAGEADPGDVPLHASQPGKDEQGAEHEPNAPHDDEGFERLLRHEAAVVVDREHQSEWDVQRCHPLVGQAHAADQTSPARVECVQAGQGRGNVAPSGRERADAEDETDTAEGPQSLVAVVHCRGSEHAVNEAAEG
mmetsp:Transcript_798/g.2185  ORF Transcript_798/g.2185 Transcript_798/m.2185 type:complete len:262 (-) Transcript_798:270-1055(-)